MQNEQEGKHHEYFVPFPIKRTGKLYCILWNVHQQIPLISLQNVMIHLAMQSNEYVRYIAGDRMITLFSGQGKLNTHLALNLDPSLF